MKPTPASAIEILEDRIAPASVAALQLSSLNGTNGFQLNGEAAYDYSGRSVSAAGDINGDGFDDLLIGANGANPNGSRSGTTYVVFGQVGGFGAELQLSSLNGSNGFKIHGEAAYDYSGLSVSAAGDINGDGFDDILIGAYRADPNGSYSGTAYVVFGQAGGFGAALQLSSLNGSNGFKIHGEAAGDTSGRSVSKAGDINGDGFDDILIGAFGADPNGSRSGTTYVVFGRAGGFGAEFQLSSINGSNGFKIHGEAANDNSGRSVSAAGDINGDGFDDILIGANEADPNGSYSGTTYVVFGQAGGFGAALQLSSLNGSNGFKIHGEAAGDYSGNSVSAAGDINGDGFDDILIGAFGADPNAFSSGATYVVFGQAGGFGAALQLSSLNGSNGFKIHGEAVYDYSGRSVSAAGDINGDGFDDLLIGANGADPNAGNSGATYVIFGKGVKVDGKGTTATFTENDGDLVTIKTTKGAFTTNLFSFGADGTLMDIDLSDSQFQGASLSVIAKKAKGGTGDGLINVGRINATGVDLGIVTVGGDLGQIDAGDSNILTGAIVSLSARSFGTDATTQPADTINPLMSSVNGKLTALSVVGSMGGFLNVTGGTKGGIGKVAIGGNLDGSAGGSTAGLIRSSSDIGTVTIKGSVFGGADLSGILSGGKLGAVKVGGNVSSPDVDKPVTISAQGKLAPVNQADSVAIKAISVRGDVLNARILAGYNTSLGAINRDASIGTITVNETWESSSIVAGIADTTANGFGRNDSLASSPDTTPNILSSIASIVIKGSATGSAAPGAAPNNFFGITAQFIKTATINGSKNTNAQIAAAGIGGINLDTTTNNFQMVNVF